MPTDPEILKACLPLPSCPPPPVLVRSRVTVEARPTPSGKPRHARSPDRLPVNFSTLDLTLDTKRVAHRRIEVITGTERRRRWSDCQSKARDGLLLKG